MIESEVEALSRAHQMFAESSHRVPLGAGTTGVIALNGVAGQQRYQVAARRSRDALTSAARTDAATEAVIAGAQRDHAQARQLTKNVLNQALADGMATPASPMAQREALRRRAARLRAQRAHVLVARRRARRHLMALRALRYRMTHHHGPGLAGLAGLPRADGRAGVAVRAALSRLGRPYVLGRNGS